MILLAFFFPLAVYLLVLGLVNRRRYPLLVSGVWDGIGLLFGISGFLLFAGPAVLSALSERWRLFWLLGRGDVSLGRLDGVWQFSIFLSILYFASIVGGAAYFFWRQRRLTAIYNADAAQVERTLTDICQRLEINPVRSGGLFLFGLSLAPPSSSVDKEIRRQGDKEKEASTSFSLSPCLPVSLSTEDGGRSVPEQTAILDVDGFPLMRHVTLRWEPVDSPLRPLLETELSHRLSETPSEDNPLGGWLLTIGFLLLCFDLAGSLLLIALHMLPR